MVIGDEATVGAQGVPKWILNSIISHDGLVEHELKALPADLRLTTKLGDSREI